MTAFRAVLVDAVQIDNLISDPELASAEARLGAAIATRASQASVNSLGDTLGPAIVNATADKAKSTEVAAVQAALAQLIAPKATGADLDAAELAILAAQATAKTDTLAALGTATAPLATTVALTAAQVALTASVAPKATSAELTATQTAVTAAIAPKATSAEVAAVQATLAQLLTPKATGADLAAAQAAILAAQATAKTDTLAALGTATSPLATSLAVSAVQTALAACIAPKSTSAEVAAVQAAVLAAVGPKATSADLAAAQTAILSMQGLAHTDTLSAITSATAPLATTTALTAAQTALAAAVAPKATSAELTATQTAVTAAIAQKSTSVELAATQATITANAAADRAAILSAIASAGVAPGEVKSFLATAIPAGFTRLSNTDFVPSGGTVESSIASTTGTGFGDAVYVSAGANPGIWRYRIDRFQRFDLATNVPLGSAYLCPTTTTSTSGIPVALAVIGTKIYLAGVGTGSGYTASAKFYVFDTNTLVFTALADFPRALSSASGLRAIVLNDNRILFASSAAVGLTITQAATPFWIYDPVSGVAPVEVLVSLTITKFLGNTYDLLMQMLPLGQILLLDSAAPTSGNALSCCLTVTGNAIAVSAAEDIGLGSITSTSTGWFLATSTGALVGSAGTVRTYVYGSGWGAGTAPNAYGVISYGLRAKRIAGVGWLLVSGPVVGGGCLYVNLFLTAVPSAGSLVVQAVRN
jgi:hypothetical protein